MAIQPVDCIAAYIFQQLSQPEKLPKPTVVAIQGPQGSGKSYVTEKLVDLLVGAGLKAIGISLDDFYLDNASQRRLSRSQPGNELLSGRGLPGTHDLTLLQTCLHRLKNAATSDTVLLPTFDKSLHNGEGDRSACPTQARGGLDIIVLEGWMVGFSALENSTLADVYEKARLSPHAYASVYLDYQLPLFLDHEPEHLALVNESLRHYENLIWPYVHIFVRMKPENMGYVWEWRLQQEHHMKARNGGKGMTDEQVRHFVSRYMPAYELFSPGSLSAAERWKGRGLTVSIGKQREVISSESM